mmetsp:Transcript_18888/g.59370  ORF Transcript_18888/g.59370 Transcript_18888/m.59370 type:complete len:213 (-) Transcript_18888:7-645(-)
MPAPAAEAELERLLPPACKLPERLASRLGQCAVCLEALRPGQGCCRAPCLHGLHEACFREWARRSPTCPVCTLDLSTPDRDLRYRLADLGSLAVCELKHLARYLGVASAALPAGAERREWEAAVLGSWRVRLLCRRDELRALPAARLRELAKAAGAGGTLRGHVEKAELVAALLASPRFAEEEGEGAEEAPPGGDGLRCRAPVQRAKRAGPY